jgi:hypothetical protein
MAVKMGADKAMELNRHVTEHPRHPGIDQLSKGIIQINYEAKVHNIDQTYWVTLTQSL